MKILIVDDESLARERLNKMLVSEGLEDILHAQNGTEAVEMVKKHHPAVVFLDIEMPGQSGIEAAEEMAQCSPESQIVFCTAYDEFAIKAFELAAKDYLLKPFSQDRLKQALKKTKLKKDVLNFKKGNDIATLNIGEVFCFVSEDKHTFMHSSEGVYIIDDSLKSLEKRFSKNLLRIHKSALVNREELRGIHKSKGQSYALLNNTDYQPLISRRCLSAVKEELK